MARAYPLVALVGRPNVGKSTLFNRIVGERIAVVYDRPGTTRDRQQADAEWTGVGFILIDTGGIEALDRVRVGEAEPLAEDSEQFVEEIRAQAELAIQDADVIIFVVDVTTGITAADEHVADILRRTNRPVVLAANKGDNLKMGEDYVDFYNLGLDAEVFPVSAMHGLGVGDLLDAVVDALPTRKPEEDDDDDSLKIAIVGRPNAGKSSLFNKLIGQERVIVSPVAGTTRDAIDTQLTYYGEPITIIDTAGIRRRGRIEPGVEKYSVLRALKAIKRADVTLLVLDATQGITAQDAHIAGFILDEQRSVIVLVNKWDAIEKDTYTMDLFMDQIREGLKFMPYVPIEFISALTGQRVNRILPLAQEVYEARFMRIPTSDVNRIVEEATARQAPPIKSGKRLKIRYASQVAVDPPKFLFHVNDLRLVHFSYERFLENNIRARYPFVGTPIVMRFKRSSEDRGKR
ncbi:MAG: ribosome biogenesis GTPase Der [Chloroflexi bacterium]|nr:ribosome biogenesis GTPase Der [Chloroflexota bacterium]